MHVVKRLLFHWIFKALQQVQGEGGENNRKLYHKHNEYQSICKWIIRLFFSLEVGNGVE